MKKTVFTLVLACILSIGLCAANRAVTPPAAEADSPRYSLDDFRSAEVLDASPAGSAGQYRTLQIGQDIVYAFEDKNGETEYAYSDSSGNVHYARYDGEELLESKVYTDSDFQTRTQSVSPELENAIDQIVREHPFADASELQREFAKAGLSDVTVTEEDGAILINPFS